MFRGCGQVLLYRKRGRELGRLGRNTMFAEFVGERLRGRRITVI